MRIPVTALSSMRPVDFVDLLPVIRDELKGTLNSNTCHITEKIDGMSWTIGVDEDAKIYAKTSTSGRIYTDDGFFQRDIAKNYDGRWGKKFDEIFKSFKEHNELMLHLMDKRPIEITGELLYNDLGITNHGKIKFSRISYDSDLLGNTWTFIPLRGTFGKFNLPELTGLSNISYKICDITGEWYSAQVLDLVEKIIADILQQSDKPIDTLKSLKHKDRDLKTVLKTLIKFRAFELETEILNQMPNKGLFGDSCESYVFELPTGDKFKVVTNNFVVGDWLYE